MIFKNGDKVKHADGETGVVVNPALEGIEYKMLDGTWKSAVAVRLDRNNTIYEASPANLTLIEN